MIEFPPSTSFGRRVPKQKFYENITMSPQLKRAFVVQISQITWLHKIAPSTANLAEGESVKEVEVFLIRLNQRGLDTKVLTQIDKEIPYHVLFLLEYGGETQAWIGYKEESQTNSGTFKPGTYYHTEWSPPENLILRLEGWNIDAAYENLIRQVAGGRLQTDADKDIGDAINQDERRQKLEKEIAALEKKIQLEKQFNRQVDLNSELKRLKAESEGLG